MIEVEEFTDNFLTCSICQAVYDDPATLDCGHTYCRKCLTALIKSRPDAERDTNIPCALRCDGTPVPESSKAVETWASQIKPSFIIIKLMDEFVPVTGAACTKCEINRTRSTAAKWCPVCRQSLCEGCIVRHRRAPTTRQHTLRDMSNRVQQEKLPYQRCDEHRDEFVKLICQDCNKAICNTCCSLHHRNCSSVVLMETKLEHIQARVIERKTQLQTEIESMGVNIAKLCSQFDNLDRIKMKTQSDIKAVFERIIKIIKEKESTLMRELEDMIDEAVRQVQETLREQETSLQVYQQHFHFIDQALGAGSINDTYNICQSSLPATNQSQHRAVVDVRFNVNSEQLQDDINKLDFGTLDVQCERSNHPRVPFISPVLADVVEGKYFTDNKKLYLYDIAVLDIDGVQTVVVTDFNSKCLKSFYTRNNEPCQSKLTFDSHPNSITKLTNNKIMVTVVAQIVTVEVTPDLVLRSTIKTSKSYMGLAVISPSVFAAGSGKYVDIINTEGHVMKSISTHNGVELFHYPWYMCVNKGNLLVSDCKKMSVTCLTSEGDVVWIYPPTGDQALRDPKGITSTTTGDILLVDRTSHKVIQLTESGQYVGDILTKQDGLSNPQGICVHNDNSLFVCESYSGKIKHFTFN